MAGIYRGPSIKIWDCDTFLEQKKQHVYLSQIYNIF